MSLDPTSSETSNRSPMLQPPDQTTLHPKAPDTRPTIRPLSGRRGVAPEPFLTDVADPRSGQVLKVFSTVVREEISSSKGDFKVTPIALLRTAELPEPFFNEETGCYDYSLLLQFWPFQWKEIISREICCRFPEVQNVWTREEYVDWRFN